MTKQYVARDGDTGRAIGSGAEVPVDAVLERLALTGSVERVLEIFPSLTREGLNAALRFAAVAVQREVPYEQGSGVGVYVARETAAAAYGLSTDVDEVMEEPVAASRGRRIADAVAAAHLLDRIEDAVGLVDEALLAGDLEEEEQREREIVLAR